MNKSMSKQKGMTVTVWIFIIAIVLFFVLLGIKMIPSYMQFHSIGNILESLESDDALDHTNPRAIRKGIERRFDINGIYDFDSKNITIKKSKEGTNVQVEYEVREEVAGNVDVIMSFFTEVNLK